MADTEFDQRVGRNVSALRGEKTQQSLADEMRLRGHRWTQATVWGVEQGRRTLRFNEALDLVEILTGSDAMVRFLGAEESPHLSAEVALKGLLRTYKRAVDSVLTYMQERARVANELRFMPQHWVREQGAWYFAKQLLSEEGNADAIVERARDLWAQSPLVDQVDAFEQEGADVEAAMKSYISTQEALPLQTWQRISSSSGVADGEHQEAP